MLKSFKYKAKRKSARIISQLQYTGSLRFSEKALTYETSDSLILHT